MCETRIGSSDFEAVARRFDELPSILATKADLEAHVTRCIRWMLASQVSFFTIMSVLIVFTR